MSVGSLAKPLTAAVLVVAMVAGTTAPHPAVISAAAVEAIAENADLASPLAGSVTPLEAGPLGRAAREAVTEECDLLPQSGLRPVAGERLQSAGRLHESGPAGTRCLTRKVSAADATIRGFVQSLLTRRRLADASEVSRVSAGVCLRL